jgi:hypothetical protein
MKQAVVVRKYNNLSLPSKNNFQNEISVLYFEKIRGEIELRIKETHKIFWYKMIFLGLFLVVIASTMATVIIESDLKNQMTTTSKPNSPSETTLMTTESNSSDGGVKIIPDNTLPAGVPSDILPWSRIVVGFLMQLPVLIVVISWFALIFDILIMNNLGAIERMGRYIKENIEEKIFKPAYPAGSTFELYEGSGPQNPSDNEKYWLTQYTLPSLFFAVWCPTVISIAIAYYVSYNLMQQLTQAKLLSENAPVMSVNAFYIVTISLGLISLITIVLDGIAIMQGAKPSPLLNKAKKVLKICK